MKCEFGYCSICEKEIAPMVDGTRHLGSQYTEVEMKWSNGSKMQVAVCTDCAAANAHATAHAKAGITHAHWDVWDKQQGTYDKEVILV